MTEQPPLEIPLTDEDEARLQLDRQEARHSILGKKNLEAFRQHIANSDSARDLQDMERENRRAVALFQQILDMTDNGDCVEDFDNRLYQFQIGQLTSIVREYLRVAEDAVKYHGMSDRDRILAACFNDEGTLTPAPEVNEDE